MPDLSRSFGRPASARSPLSGMLPPRATPPPRSTVEAAPPDEPEREELIDAPPITDSASDGEADTTVMLAPSPRPASAAPSQAREPRSQSSGREVRQAPAAQDQSQTYQTVVYISSQAKAAAERRRRQSGCSNAEIVFDALDDAHELLHELLAERVVIERSPESLFPSRRVSRRASSPSTRRVSFTFRATAAELQVIRDLVRDFDAGSISEIVAVALDHSSARNRRR
jgi:hypothetical protein